MKNLILTFVFALVSLVSFTQISYTINNSNEVNITTIDTTIKVTNGDSIKFNTTYDLIETQSNFINQIPGSILQENQYIITNDVTIYLKFIIAGSTAVNITVIFEGTASTSENTLTREELKVYPSPATSDIKISFSADKSDMPLNIFSLNGQLVHQDNTSREVGAINIVELNVSGWSAGIYLVNNGKETFKFVVL